MPSVRSLDMPDPDPSGPLVSMQRIHKSFPGVQALIDVDFDLRSGEIHALMGGNGAGKSTLIKILTGVERPDSGKIFLGGREVVVRSPKHAQALGISTVYQEINLCRELDGRREHPDRPPTDAVRSDRLEADEPAGQ